MPTENLDDRVLTTDLREGLGLFRWGDTKATILKLYPEAGFGLSAMYATKKVVNVTGIVDVVAGGGFVPVAPLLGCIDPDKTAPRLLAMTVPTTFDNSSVAEVDAAFSAWMAQHGQTQAPGDDGDALEWEFEGLTLSWSREDGHRVWVSRG